MARGLKPVLWAFSLDGWWARPYSRAHDQCRDHADCSPPPHYSGLGGRSRLRSSPLPLDLTSAASPLKRYAVRSGGSFFKQEL